MALSTRALELLQQTEQPLSEVKPTFKALIYGGIGAGKTYTAMHIAHMLTPEDKDIIYVDYAEGWTAIKDVDKIVKHSRRFQYNGLKHLQVLIQAISEKAPGFENVGAIVLDEYSSMVDSNLEEIVKEMHKQDPGKYDEYMPEWPHYNRNKVMCTRIHRALNHIPGVNVIYITHVKERVEQDTGKNYVEPNLNPSYGKDFLQDLQLVGFMTADVRQDKYTRKIQVQPEKRVAAKNRLGLSTTVSPGELVDGVKKFMGEQESEKPKANPIEVK